MCEGEGSVSYERQGGDGGAEAHADFVPRAEAGFHSDMLGDGGRSNVAQEAGIGKKVAVDGRTCESVEERRKQVGVITHLRGSSA